MAEGKVRLVRCPKCQNVLPELSYYSLYQCGGCGAVLRAKSRSLKADSVSVGIADEKKEDDESESFSEKAAVTVTKVDGGSLKESDALNPTGVEIGDGESIIPSVVVVVEEEEEEIGAVELTNSSICNGVNSSRSIQSISGDYPSIITSTEKLHTAPRNVEEHSAISANVIHKSENDVLENQERCSTTETRSPTVDLHPMLLDRQNGSLKNQDTMEYFNRTERATLLKKVEELKEKLTETCDLVDKQRVEIPCGRMMSHMDVPSPSGLVDTSFQLYNHNNPMNLPSSCYDTELYGDSRSHLLKTAPNSAPCHHQNHLLPPSHLSFFDNYTTSFSNPCPQHKYNSANGSIPCSSRSCVHHGGFSEVQRNLLQRNHPYGCPNRHPCSYDGNGRWCGKRYLPPVAGAAPFITCCHCFELLQIPNQVIGIGNKKKMARVSCGCCSKIMVISMVNQRVVVSADRHPSDIDVNPRAGGEGGRDMRRGNMNSCYDDSGYDFQCIDGGEPITPVDPGLDSSQDMHSVHSSSRCTSFNEECPPLDKVNVADEGFSLSPPPLGSPVQEQLEPGDGRFGRGNRSSRCDQEKVKMMKKCSRQNSLKDVALESEVEIPPPISDCPDIVTPQDSKSHPISSCKGDSFFTGIIKKSFRDFSKYNHAGSHGKSCVHVNGHAISDRAARKAERKAGPIYPGKYWYDMKAGFWGVMGGPCLGIISPYIEEFSYPMSVECSGGNTLVFVNGRELHKKDMDLLSSRGLPTHPRMYYSIDISGKVIDLNSGLEFHGLGKLAPTVEKMKRGFGMKVPMAAV